MAAQIGLYKPTPSLPLANQVNEQPKEQYIDKPLIITTIETPQPIKGNHPFAFGNCTAYVAGRVGGVPWSGDAREWLYNAPRYNYDVGDIPLSGAILVTNESYAGHVAYVESVDNKNITVSEMNYSGFNVISKRTIPKNAKFIKGFIYLN